MSKQTNMSFVPVIKESGEMDDEMSKNILHWARETFENKSENKSENKEKFKDESVFLNNLGRGELY